MLNKMIFKVDHLICSECGGVVKIVSIIDRYQTDVENNILKHYTSSGKLFTTTCTIFFANELEFTEEVSVDLYFLI